jgi:hypothetical protein
MRPILVGSVSALATLATLAPAAHAATPIAHPAGHAAIVLRVSTGGGFVPVSVNLRALPQFTLYGDGTVIVPGAQIQIAPQPATLPLERFHLTRAQVQALLVRARRAGLLARGPIDYGDMGSIGVSDAPGTTVLLNAAGRRLERDAYALGIDTTGGRLSAAQVAARRALSAFIAALPHGASASPYAAPRLAVYVGPYTGTPQPGARPIIWPLASDLARAGARSSSGLPYRCFTVSSGNARRLDAALHRATVASQWRMPGAAARYELIVRPLLPEQRTCTV